MNFVMKKSLERRAFLRGMGATLALPFLDAMVPALSVSAKALSPTPRLGFIYIANGVIQEQWVPATTGKRRIHDKPNAREIAACRPWLDAEIERIKPKLIVCLGATAAQTLLGKTFKVTEQRGKAIKSALAPNIVATVHPSSLYKIPDPDERHKAIRQFVSDIKKAMRLTE